MSYIPYVIEKNGKREKAYDLYSRLMKDRVIFIGTPINDMVANTACAQLLFLTLQSKDKPISIYLNSPGGSVTAGMAIFDTIRHIPNCVETFCIGQCASMGAVLLAAGTKGHRFILPHGQVMIHQPWGGMQGTASDVQIQAENLLLWKAELNKVLAECTGQPLEVIQRDTERDFFLQGAKAKDYGIVDQVLTPVAKEAEPAPE